LINGRCTLIYASKIVIFMIKYCIVNGYIRHQNKMNEPIWITYAWIDNDEGDFDYLVQELGKADISAIYDKIALIPGRRLWAQIAEHITSDPLSAWAYLITPNSLRSSACQEELNYALQRALETKGEEFPLIGLLHNVSFKDVPVALRIRLCVNLANPDWIEEVRAGVSGIPPKHVVPLKDPYIFKVHKDYLGRKGHIAIEVRPRFGGISYWRLAFPSNGPQPIGWGAGPANGGGFGVVLFNKIEGEYPYLAGIKWKFVGAGSPISAATSAYAEFEGRLPEKFFFGVAKEAFNPEADGVILTFRDYKS
jgi:hypothetical protein